MAVQMTTRSRKETETTEQSPEEKNKVPIFKILKNKCRPKKNHKHLNNQKKCLK